VPVIIKHAKTGTIADWTQADLDQQIAAGNYPPGTVLADIVLPSDWNNDHTFTGLGTMAEQDATAVAITGGTINNTTIGATTATTGKFTSVTTPSVTATTNDLTLSAISTGAVKLNTVGGEALRAVDNGTTSGAAYWVVKGASGGFPTFGVDGTNPNIYTTIYAKGTVGEVRFATNTTTVQQVVSHTASAVNYVQVTGAATGNAAGPLITAQGSDASVPLSLQSKLNSPINFFTSGGFQQFRVNNLVNAVNYLQVQGSVAGNATPLSAIGNDTNISMAFQPKGTGAIDLAAGSSGVNISNGGTVTAITRTNGGANYTSNPTIAISAPTTAGGVQAVLAVNSGPNLPTIASGGTGYTVGDVLTFVGGTFTTAYRMNVTSVSGGVITGISPNTFGSYTVFPASPVSVTGGTGSGATFTATNYSINIPTITNAGSGYIEQPTITFSGGGGSGAAAYATVGGTTTIKTIGNTMNFYAANSGIGLQVYDATGSNGASGGYWRFAQNYSTNAVMFASSTGAISSGGATNLSFFTNTVAQEQLRVSHTASAVNYVQVTGSATTAAPVISAQGSDSNVTMTFSAKSAGFINLGTGGGTQTRITHTASAVNVIGLTGAVAGSAPSISALALTTDTNVDLKFTPLGTGVVQFGTYTAGVLTPTGYVTIKTSDGTTRRLLVG
jgi:hypothetical protein